MQNQAVNINECDAMLQVFRNRMIVALGILHQQAEEIQPGHAAPAA